MFSKQTIWRNEWHVRLQLCFCAILRFKSSSSDWMRPGNFNSHLLAIIWVVQPLIFYDVARKERPGQSEMLPLVKQYCEDYVRQTVETPMGEILWWWLLMFQVSRDTVGDHKAAWDENEVVLTFENTDYIWIGNECSRLLYNDTMFRLENFRRRHARAPKNDSSQCSWLGLHPASRQCLDVAKVVGLVRFDGMVRRKTYDQQALRLAKKSTEAGRALIFATLILLQRKLAHICM